MSDDNKVRAHNVGVTLSYPRMPLSVKMPVPASSGIPGEAFVPSGVAKLDDGKLSLRAPVVRIHYTFGARHDTAENSRKTTFLFLGVNGEVRPIDYEQNARSLVGSQQVSRLKVKGWLFQIGAYLETQYLMTPTSMPEGWPEWLLVMGADFIFNFGPAHLQSTVTQPGGGQDRATAIPVLFNGTLHTRFVGFSFNKVSVALGWDASAHLQITSFKSDETTGPAQIIDTGPAISMGGHF